MLMAVVGVWEMWVGMYQRLMTVLVAMIMMAIILPIMNLAGSVQ